MEKTEVEVTRERFIRFCGDLVPTSMRKIRMQNAAHEFDVLCAHMYVAGIAADEDVIFVGTTLLIADDDIHEVGEFLLMISREAVTWENLTRQVKGFHAPYVSHKKTCCGIRSEEAELNIAIKDGRLDRAFLTMVDIARATPGYLEEVRISKWPVYEKQPRIPQEVVKPVVVQTLEKKGFWKWKR